MATDVMQGGVRRYVLLTPISLVVDGETATWTAVHLLPVTRKITREWFDGLIQGPNGALEALVDRLTFEPYYVIEEMQHPDVELFDREFMTHLPPAIRDALASGQFPAPAAPEPAGPTFPLGPYDDDPGPWNGETPDPVAPPPPQPRRPPPPIPRDRMPPAPAPATASPHAHMDGANFELAEMGPDESLGTPEQQARAAAARGEAMGDGKGLARDLTEEPADTKSPLAAAVERSAAPPEWTPTPRDPFNPTRPPPRKPAIRPPTRVSAESMPLSQALPGTAEQVAPGVDQRTGREPVFAPKGDYVPDMSAAGYEESPNALAKALGIGE